MTYSHWEEAAHSRNLASLCPIHGPVNPSKEKCRALDLPPAYSQLSCRSPHPEHQVSFEFSNFRMTAPSRIWTYIYRFEKNPSQQLAVLGCNSFSFSDVRNLITQTTSDNDFILFRPDLHRSAVHSLMTPSMRMAA
jgi:hypothetical protein